MKTSPHSDSSSFVCKLTLPEFSRRKAAVLGELKKQVIESKETPSGFAYKFNASNTVIDQVLEFIKSERQCCEFFKFTLSIGNEHEGLWLELSGAEGIKAFIKAELEF